MHVVTFLLPNLRRLYLVHRNLDLDSEREQKKFRKAKILHNWELFCNFANFKENIVKTYIMRPVGKVKVE